MPPFFSLHLRLFFFAALGYCFSNSFLLFTSESASADNRLIIEIETLSKKEVRCNSVSGVFLSQV